MSSSSAWYAKDRESFLQEDAGRIVEQLSRNAGEQGLIVEREQYDEWRSSIGILQREIAFRTTEIELLRKTLSSPDLAEYRQIILEFDFHRRGLRMDCVLLGNGVVAVIEFKRQKIVAADRDQVDSYCVNLLEFHDETRRLAHSNGVIIAPVLALTLGKAAPIRSISGFRQAPWDCILRAPVICDASSLHVALREILTVRRGTHPLSREAWLNSKFSPSSTIIDAAISLYGQHDVSAISDHAAPVALIARCTEEVSTRIAESLSQKENRIIFISGAPGAGKTLVGLRLAFDSRFRRDAVFVTGNAPLVEVLSAALKNAYRTRHLSSRSGISVLSGYSKKDARHVISMSTFKIVKAHTYLGDRGNRIDSINERVVIFDEAQRTYEKGRLVLRKALEEDEARLILQSLERSFGKGCVVIALIGHNQAINRGEIGISAWFKAAIAQGWKYAIADETLSVSEVPKSEGWANHPLREKISVGHLAHSLRYYRNSGIERWASAVLEDHPRSAEEISEGLHERGDTLWVTRDLAEAKAWVRQRRTGDERAGIIASGQARRLAAEGLFVDLKPDIASWMLAPSGDVRSSNALETVQNQYQIQGLEIDYAIACWDIDLRRERGGWQGYKMSGSDWQRDGELEVSKNGYRVLLTRARKGMVIFVPHGDSTREDSTRPPEAYDAIVAHLVECGARMLGSSAQSS